MTNSRKHTRAARRPYFKPVEDLQQGDPFNPYKLYQSYSVAHELGRFKKLRPAAKWVWHILATECYSSGYDRHAQASLAFYAGLSVDQFQYHLARLKKLRLVHVEAELGRENWHWLLYHPLFASCSLLTPGKTPVGVPQNSGTYLPENSGTQSTYKSTYRDMGTPGIYDVTSIVVPPAQNGGEKAKVNGNGKNLAAISDNEYAVHSAPPNSCNQNGESTNPSGTQKLPLLKANARRSWNTLEKRAQEIRFERACELAGRINYLRQHLNSPDASIGRQARMQEAQAMRELSDAGFYLAQS